MAAKIDQLCDRVWWVGNGGWGQTKLLSKPGDCNVYLVDAGLELVLVDTGCGPDAAEVFANVRAAGFPPEKITKILLTHAHGDHSGGAAWIRAMTGAPIYAGAVTARALATPEVNMIGGLKPFERFVVTPFAVDRYVCDGQEFAAGAVAFTAFFTPGHSIDSFCYLARIRGRKVLFAGDTVIGNQRRPDIVDGRVFKGMLGWLDGHWSAPLTTYQASLRRLIDLEPDLLMPGHGVHHDAETAVDAMQCGIRNIQKVLDDPDLFVMFTVER